MAQALANNRKRVRNLNCDEECCDFMPLSKRINNLHINAGGNDFSVCGINKNDQPYSNGAATVNWSHAGPRGIIMSGHHPVQCCSTGKGFEEDWGMEYSPDLTAAENPHYFEKNKLLFELYVQRLNRGPHTRQMF